VHILLGQEDFWGTWLGEAVGLLSIPILLALNGFFVAAEFALVAVRKTRVEEMVTQKIPGARSVAKAVQHIDRTIAATQLGITLTSLALGMVSETVLARGLESFFRDLPSPWNFLARHTVATTLALLIITFLHVVFGELFPKSLAIQAPDRVALWAAGPLSVFARIARPLIVVINGTGRFTLRLFGLQVVGETDMVHSVEELALVIEDTEQAGILAHEQAELVQNVFRLSNKCARDCMIPRDKMAALELNTPRDKILEAVHNGAHTRLPVYEGDINNIVGIVNTKNLFYLFSLRGVVVLEDALYPALFLKPEERIANALRLFQKARRPMALVRDAAGTILGLITLEDVLEEIVGDIEDEHDFPIPKVVRIKKDKSTADSRITKQIPIEKQK
jgi:CBS domain containing-hemolysin-like protein